MENKIRAVQINTIKPCDCQPPCHTYEFTTTTTPYVTQFLEEEDAKDVTEGALIVITKSTYRKGNHVWKIHRG